VPCRNRSGHTAVVVDPGVRFIPSRAAVDINCCLGLSIRPVQYALLGEYSSWYAYTFHSLLSIFRSLLMHSPGRWPSNQLEAMFVTVVFPSGEIGSSFVLGRCWIRSSLVTSSINRSNRICAVLSCCLVVLSRWLRSRYRSMVRFGSGHVFGTV
jgi:hypothetical protein